MCAEFSLELDEVETREIGLSIAFPKEQGERMERKAHSNNKDDIHKWKEHLEPDERPDS